MSQYSCPNCGDDITPTIARARLMACPSCGSSVLIENEAVRLASEARDLGETGDQQMKDMVVAMRDIDDASNNESRAGRKECSKLHDGILNTTMNDKEEEAQMVIRSDGNAFDL